jgi:hypothetical protein
MSTAPTTAPTNDLTFQQLLDSAPAGSIVVTNGKVLVDVSSFNGESVATLDSTGVVEFATKLLQSAQAAQTAVNANNSTAGTRLAAFSAPNYQTPVVNADGSVSANVSLSMTATLPVSSLHITGPTN